MSATRTVVTCLLLDTHITTNVHSFQRPRSHATDCKLLTQHIFVYNNVFIPQQLQRCILQPDDILELCIGSSKNDNKAEKCIVSQICWLLDFCINSSL